MPRYLLAELGILLLVCIVVFLVTDIATGGRISDFLLKLMGGFVCKI